MKRDFNDDISKWDVSNVTNMITCLEKHPSMGTSLDGMLVMLKMY